MVILVKVFANLRDICGGVTVEVRPTGNRIMDILDKMIDDFPALQGEIFTSEKKLKSFVHVYINGRNIIQAKAASANIFFCVFFVDCFVADCST